MRMKSEEHSPNAWCECTDCVDDKDMGCRDPHACAIAVSGRLGELLPKWDPRAPTPGRGAQQQPADDAPVIFKPPPQISHISEGLRVLTKLNRVVAGDAAPLVVQVNLEGMSREVVVSGACIGIGQADTQAGSGVWYGEGNHRNKSLRLPENFDQTISSAEIVAALYAVQTTP
ncbi:hypothetical protein C8J57DRAFT_971791, partial [Mycena rebaudengoi]